MRWQCFDTSARLEHARNHQKAYCNKGMYVDNLCSELYSFPITLSQKQCQSIFRAHELLLLFFVYLVPAFITVWLLETDQYVFPVGQLNEQDRFFSLANQK